MSDGEIVDLSKHSRAFRLRLAGVAPRRIAEELGCTVKQVEELLASMCPAVSPELRERTRQLELARLDELQRAHYAAALAGGATATMVVLKIMERRSRMLGLDVPTRIEAVQLLEPPARETSTERIRRVLADLVAEGDPGGDGDDHPELPPPTAPAAA